MTVISGIMRMFLILFQNSPKHKIEMLCIPAKRKDMPGVGDMQ